MFQLMAISYRSTLLGLLKSLAAIVLLANVGCSTTVTLDMRNIEEPVMLNALPYAERDWPVREVGRVKATVDKDNAYISNKNTTWSSSSHTNNVEVNVYEEIGGHDSRAVSGASIRVAGFGLNLLFAYLGGVSIDVAGVVVELDSEIDEQKGENDADEGSQREAGE